VFGVPYIIVWTVVLEAALFVMYVLFVRYYWTDDAGGEA
jgi:hypothetical protein